VLWLTHLTTPLMTRKNDFSWPHFIELTKKRHKKKFGKSITATEIRKITKKFISDLIDKVIEGGNVKINKHSSIEVVGTKILEDDIFKLLVKGKSLRRDGTMKNAEFNPRRKEFKYRIVYENSLNKDLRFKADPKFAKRVHQALISTNNYYRIHEQASLNR